jgi:23S rRNA (uracil1939-C5)-methyltransferase
VFVWGVLVGEIVKIKIIKVKKNMLVGKLLEIRKKSDLRQEPYCDVYKKCGGCSFQHMKYGYQIEVKKNIVAENIKHIGLLKDVNINDCLGMDSPFHYRNKVQYPIKIQDEKVCVGFYERKTHRIVEANTCFIHNQEMSTIKAILKNIIEKMGISIYDEESGKGILRHILIRESFATNEKMLVLVINGKKISNQKQLIDEILDKLEFVSIIFNINTSKTNVILGKENIVAHGKSTIIDVLGNYKFEISPNSFYQVNPMQMKVLYDKVIEFAEFKGNETVFDLYSGIGTISIYISEYVNKVYGIEIVHDAVMNANRNKEINNIKNVEFIEGDVGKKIINFCDRGVKADIIIVDPPRKGCEKILLDSILKLLPKKVIYVSCNSSTLARDLKYLCENGYEVRIVQPIDMFPQTEHVECVVLIEWDG